MFISRRQRSILLVLASLLLAPAALLLAADPPKSSVNRPNVLIILSDDMGFSDAGLLRR